MHRGSQKVPSGTSASHRRWFIPRFRPSVAEGKFMAEQASGNHGLAAHGAAELTSVIVDTYNAELRDKDGFVGDRASRRAFRAILDDWRERVRKNGDDPIGKADSEDISKKKLD